MTTTNPISEKISSDNVTKLVKSAVKAYGTARGNVQAAAIAIIEHAQAYGDCSQAKVLARGVPVRERNSLIGYFAMFSPIGIKMGATAKDDACRFIRPESNLYNTFNLDGAKAHNWFDDPGNVNAPPKPLATIVDFYEVIDRMLKKAIADAEKDEKYVPEQVGAVKEQAQDLLGIVNKYRAKHIVAANPFAPADDLPELNSDAPEKVAA